MAHGWIKERFLRDASVSARALAADAITADKLPGGFLKIAVVDGGAAGNIAVDGIGENHELVSVLMFEVDDGAFVDIDDLTDEFEIEADDVIDNDGETNTTGHKLVVVWLAI